MKVKEIIYDGMDYDDNLEMNILYCHPEEIDYGTINEFVCDEDKLKELQGVKANASKQKTI